MTNPILAGINTMRGRRETNRQTSPYIDNNLIDKIINNNNIINNINNINNIKNIKNKDDFINSCLTTNDNHNVIEFNLKMVIAALNTEINYLRTEISNFNIKVKNLESEVGYLREKMEQMEEKQNPDSRCCVCLVRTKEYANFGCGHKCLCSTCVLRVEDGCPLCKNPCNDWKRIFD